MVDSASDNSQSTNTSGVPSPIQGTGLEGLLRLANSGALEVLQQLSEAGSLEVLLEAAKAVAEAKKASAATVLDDSDSKKIWQDKQLIYGDENAFIYRRGDTKAKFYQLYIKDPNRKKKPYTKSLKTADTTKAIVLAREEYKSISEKLRKGERVRSITSSQLVDLYLKSLEQKITNIPRKGITPETFRIKKVLLRMWLDFIEASGLAKKVIEAIQPEETENFIFWTIQQSVDAGAEKSVDYVNKAAIEVVSMYKKIALKRKYITYEVMPVFEKYSSYQTEGIKRDIFTIEEWTELQQWISLNWIWEESISQSERLKRRIFYCALSILFDTGMRPKELLSLRWNDIDYIPYESGIMAVIKIRQENSKNAKSRTIVSNSFLYFDELWEMQKKLLPHLDFSSDSKRDWLVMVNPFLKDLNSYKRQSLDHRLRQVLEKSGLEEKMSKLGKEKLSLYSARHSAITWMIEENIPTPRISKQVGTSEKNIENIYGKPDPLKNYRQLLDAKPDSQKAQDEYYKKLNSSRIDGKTLNINPSEDPTRKEYYLNKAAELGLEITVEQKPSGFY